MTLIDVQSYACGGWVAPAAPRLIRSAIDGAPVAQAGTGALDLKAMARFARDVGCQSLCETGFHERARMLKALAQHLTERKDALHALSLLTGATPADGAVSVDAIVETVDYQGQAVRYFVHAGDRQLQAINMIDERPFAEGAQVSLRLRPRDCAVLPTI